MLLFVRTWVSWLRRHLDRRELAAAGVALAAAGLLWRARWLPVPYQLVLGAMLLVALAVLARLLLPRLLGPVFFYDLVRTSRRSRYFLLRGGYATVLLLTLFIFYTSWLGVDLSDLLTGATVPGNQVTRFATSFFTVFVSVQLGVVILLAPVFTAGAITEEKERRTLEYLLTTDLRDREIVLGKLVSRLASLALVVLAGLPILSLVQFLGGIDPNLLLAGFAATVLTMVSVASLGLLNSVYVNRTRDAIFLTYLETVVYLVASGLCCGTLLAAPAPLTFLALPGAGNIFVAMARLSEAVSLNALDRQLWVVLRDYAIFHGLVTVGCVVWASWMLRREARQQASGKVQVVRVELPQKGDYVLLRRPNFEPPPKYRPPLTGDPILWKEMYFDSGFRLSHWAVGIAVSLAAIALYIAGAVFVTGVLFALAVGSGLIEFSNGWVRLVGTPIACLMIIAVAVRAAGAISGERERQTLDGLLTTPLTDRHILWGKWWASILSVRKAWWCLGVIWALGVFTGGLCPFALPLLAAGWFVYAGFAAALGLCFSLSSRTTLRATVWTLLALIAASTAHWVVGICLQPLLSTTRSPRYDWLTDFHLYGLTPPWTLGFLAFYIGDFEGRAGIEEPWGRLGACLFGLVLYGTAALLLWLWLQLRFGPMTGRVPSRVRSP
ncbi:MAG TPA: ABC transporter permease subunit [Gemmataceae bacterium]|nr:ABC transporter permease subunit [Gemmataceae bacterium]